MRDMGKGVGVGSVTSCLLLGELTTSAVHLDGEQVEWGVARLPCAAIQLGLSDLLEWLLELLGGELHLLLAVGVQVVVVCRAQALAGGGGCGHSLAWR